MGLFDTVYAQKNIVEHLDLRCDKCQNILLNNFQTKSFGENMEDYILVFDNFNVKMNKLDEPNDQRFWVEYSREEIEASKGKPWPVFELQSGDGYFKAEAFLVENRNKRNMGELPHGFVNLTGHCKNCNSFPTFEAKFTDGILVKILKK